MKIVRVTFLMLLLLLELSSCDPMRTLTVKAPESSGTAVTIYGNNGFFSHNGEREEEGFVLQVSSTDQQLPKDTTLFLGFGTWPSRKFMAKDAQLLDSIVFQSRNGTRVIRDPDQISKILVKSRRGILKNNMVIRVK